MNIKLDENLPVDLRQDLRDLGHDAETVHDEGLAGAPDARILDHVRHEQRMLWTLDKGIANLREYPPERYAGIVLFRPAQTGRGAVLTFVRRHLVQILTLDLDGRLLIVSEHALRLR